MAHQVTKVESAISSVLKKAKLNQHKLTLDRLLSHVDDDAVAAFIMIIGSFTSESHERLAKVSDKFDQITWLTVAASLVPMKKFTTLSERLTLSERSPNDFSDILAYLSAYKWTLSSCVVIDKAINEMIPAWLRMSDIVALNGMCSDDLLQYKRNKFVLQSKNTPIPYLISSIIIALKKTMA